jgi:hypothetical protein
MNRPQTFISVRPGGRTVRYRKVGRRWERNPLPLGLTPLELGLIVAGVGAAGYVAYLLLSASQAPSSPPVSVAAGEPGTVTPPTWTGAFLGAGYFWGDQSNTTTPALLSTVKALAMTSYGLASTITGTVYIPLSPAGNVSFFVTGQSPDDPNSGVSYGQAITLPLSYVSAA